MLGLVITALVLLIVVPLAVLVPLFIVALVLIAVLFGVAGVAALAFSPVILCAGFVWLIWRLARGSGRHAGGATIAR